MEAGLPSGWRELPVRECLDPRVRRRPSIQRTQYNPTGLFPIVDQGAVEIAGYTDDESTVYRSELPLIVFGDHTRRLKFRSEPFAAGADGTQLLKPASESVDPRFLFFALSALSIPNRGYNRHLALLLEETLRIPDTKGEQRAIAHTLLSLQRRLDLARRKLETLRELKAATMDSLFRDQEEWEPISVRDLGEIVTGATPPTSNSAYFDGPIPFVTPADLGTTMNVSSPRRFLSLRGLRHSRPIPKGAILIVCIGSSIGKVGMSFEETSCTNQQINSIICHPGLNREFVFHLMMWNSIRVSSAATRGPVPIISKGRLGDLSVHIPIARECQDRIASVLGALEIDLDRSRLCCVILESLFGGLLNQMMQGELRIPHSLISSSLFHDQSSHNSGEPH